MTVQPLAPITHAWLELGNPGPEELGEPRRELQAAVRIAAAWGGDELIWSYPHHALIGPLVGQKQPCQAGVRLADLTLLVLSSAGSHAEVALAGKTPEAAADWLATTLRELSGGELKAPVQQLAPDGLPAGHFTGQPLAAFAELERWFINAQGALLELGREEPTATPVFCRAETLTLCTQILEMGKDGKSPRLITLGMSPGDTTYDEPYFFVRPDAPPIFLERLTLKGEGFWHFDDWFGAILLGTRMILAEPRSGQAARTAAFLRSALLAHRREPARIFT